MIDETFTILYTYGQVDHYLKVAAGEARFNIMDMLRPGLDAELPQAIRYTLNQRESTTHHNVWVQTNGDEAYVNITVKPVGGPDRHLFLIIIEKVAPTASGDAAAESDASPEAGSEQLQAVKKELAVTKNRLQKSIEELQAANEEHRSYAEELQSGNEELQSMNEELTTSQEELRSINEELVTASSEIQRKNQALHQVNNDLHNLLAATDIATIFLDNGLRIKRFTSAATTVVNLIESDKGRPFKHTVMNFKDDHLYQDLEYVLDTLNTVEREVETEKGQWFNMRIIPFRTLDNIIDGVVLTFAAITAQKHVESELRRLNEELRYARDYARKIIDTLHEGVLVLDENLYVVSANAAFYRQFGVNPQETEGKRVYDLGNGQWDIPQLRRLLEEIIPENSTIEQYDIDHDFPTIGRRTMRLNARRLNRPEGEANQILLAIEDVTDQG
ncbi:MAG: PAS domain-containing protein [Anaerolineae bacterium]|nr:PAS domain-containing protein [Anaerolineae bacterium]